MSAPADAAADAGQHRRTPRWRSVVTTTLAGAFVAASAVAAWTYLLWAFREPAAHAATRAPRREQTEVLGLSVGVSARAAIDDAIAAHELRCEDVSMKRMIEQMQAARAAAAAAAAAPASGTPDAVSSASKRAPADGATDGAGSAREHRAPAQLRLACEGVPAAILGGGRPGVPGRLLFVLDADDAPLRNVSHQRTHTDRAAAQADLAATIDALTALHGAPTELRGDAASLERLVPVIRSWRFDGLEVRVSALDHGKRGVAISEEVGVPYPTR